MPSKLERSVETTPALVTPMPRRPAVWKHQSSSPPCAGHLCATERENDQIIFHPMDAAAVAWTVGSCPHALPKIYLRQFLPLYMNLHSTGGY